MKPLYSVLFFLAFLSSNILVGQTLTYGDVYDFEIGDIFQYKKTDPDGPEDPMGPPFFIEHEIIGKYFSMNLDTVFYVKKWKKVRVPFCSTCAAERTSGIDTINYRNLNVVISGGPAPLWDTNGCMSNWASYTGKYMLSPTTYCDSITVRQKFEWADSCKYDFPFYFNYTSYKFAKGLGVTYLDYNHCGTSLIDCNYQVELLYFKKGSITCGTPIGLLNSVHQVQHLNNVKLYPNPFTNEITIESNLGTIKQLVVYDLVGEVILDQKISSTITKLNLSTLESGVYMVVLTQESGQTIIQKVIKK